MILCGFNMAKADTLGTSPDSVGSTIGAVLGEPDEHVFTQIQLAGVVGVGKCV
jgi:hypothetical protein